MRDAHNGWEASAAAWLADMEGGGDFGRLHVLDSPMLERVREGRFKTALDIGCGEGRFCRILRTEGVEPTGVEPTERLRAAAQRRDPDGLYVGAVAENLPFEDETFDLVVSYLTLIDIEGIEEAINEMVRVLNPGGSLLIANLNSFSTAGDWITVPGGQTRFQIDRYLDERPEWVSWRGISVRNWHRPLSRYMQLLLTTGLRLTHFDEPAPSGGDASTADRHRRCPYYNIMEWRKT
ncbi:class I SAM-dependent methyltransferase [Methyloligella solikamskensis]|uniref:Class I SAM-dependent methyltransferase n=1 Tax=Methyloligella solikamskensis TaxID=1177756 RepID=A0ABW3J6K5_9HYPH